MLIELPFPPSMNTYWRNVKGRTLISKKGREYRKAVIDIFKNYSSPKLTARISVEIDFYPPDRRRRDIDNSLKAPLDALTHAGVWEDDSQIDRLSIYRREVLSKGQGKLLVRISEINL